jgi:transposase
VAVRRVELEPDGSRVVHVVTAEETAAACPECGVFSTSVKQNVTTRPKDLPYGPAPLGLVWHKRRWRCRETACPRATFTEQVPQVPAWARTTGRLRAVWADAVVSNRCVDEVARSHAVSWPTVARAVDARAGEVLGEPAPTPVLGIDETRFGRPRWVRGDGGWVRTEPWETGFVDLAGSQGLLGQVEGRTSRCVLDWLADRGEAFRAAVQVVALDPSAPYAAAVRQALEGCHVGVEAVTRGDAVWHDRGSWWSGRWVS